MSAINPLSSHLQMQENIITGANGIQGMNVVVQSNNLSDASDIIQIKGIYFKA